MCLYSSHFGAREREEDSKFIFITNYIVSLKTAWVTGDLKRKRETEKRRKRRRRERRRGKE